MTVNESAKNRISSHGHVRPALQTQTKNCIKSKLLSHPGYGCLKWLKWWQLDNFVVHEDVSPLVQEIYNLMENRKGVGGGPESRWPTL